MEPLMLFVILVLVFSIITGLGFYLIKDLRFFDSIGFKIIFVLSSIFAGISVWLIKLL